MFIKIPVRLISCLLRRQISIFRQYIVVSNKVASYCWFTQLFSPGEKLPKVAGQSGHKKGDVDGFSYFSLLFSYFIGFKSWSTALEASTKLLHHQCSKQGWFLLENKITENQWKIAKTIYIPLFMTRLSSNFRQFLSGGK
jgi:hypothetical protein